MDSVSLRKKNLKKGKQQDGEVKGLDLQVIELYRGVAKVMARYTSGMIPKAFKIIPTLSNWEEILELTKPHDWSRVSVHEATKLFSSNLKSDMAQKFYNIVLLPRIRDDIERYKKLNAQLYMALKRALYKPAAFYKGIVLPLCEDEDCTLREAVIVSSVVKRSHVPLLHSAAAMLKISEMPTNSVRCIFLRDLISKNYALPYRVLDGLVDHFIRLTYNDEVELNVQWHQTLLKFCQLYTRDISSEQREALMELIRKHSHHQITPEVRQLLLKTPSRDIELTDGERQEQNDDDDVDDIDEDDDDDSGDGDDQDGHEEDMDVPSE